MRGPDRTIYIAAPPTLRQVREGTVTVTAGIDRLVIHLPPGSPPSSWRETTDQQGDLSLAVRLEPWDARPSQHDVEYRAHGDERTLTGPRFHVTWCGARGELWCGKREGDDLAFHDDLHEAALAILIARAVERGGLAFHAAALEVDGQVAVAAGASGSGKSTLAARFPEHLLTEECAILVPTTEGWKHALYAERRGAYRVQGRALLPVAAVWALQHGTGVSHGALAKPSEVWSTLMQETTIFRGLEQRTFDNLARLLQQVPCGRFAHALDDDERDTLGRLFVRAGTS